MTEGEKRVAIILINYCKGKYTLAYLNDVLARGLKHLDECGAEEVGQRFVSNLAAIEIAIERIERRNPKLN